MSNFRRRLFSVQGGGGLQVANVGDIAYKAADGKIMVVAQDLWDGSLGTPVGVVVIPSGFAPDNGKARIAYFTSHSGSLKKSNIAGLLSYDSFPITDNKSPNLTGYSEGSGYLPSDDIYGTASYVDPIAKYSYDISENYIPSPYLGDKPNPAYYAPISGKNNALSDFNGKGNTEYLVSQGNSTLANIAHNFKIAGAEEIEWYLPAMGELGFLLARYSAFDKAAKKINSLYGKDNYMNIISSTEYNHSSTSNYTFFFNSRQGACGRAGVTTSQRTYVFAQLDF